MRLQRLYNGIRFPMPGPSLENVRRLDHFARPYVIACMERGLQVDLSHFTRMEQTLTEDMERITEEVRDLTGHYVNLDSGDQVSDLLFKKLGLKQARQKFTPSGSRESVENEVLVAIQHDHPVVPKILNFKEYSKLRGTYVRPIPTLARKVDGVWRLLPNLKDTRVPSGRLACEDPNLLAMPNRTPRGRQVCEGFITDDTWEFVSVDESQIEPRVVAHRSGDPNLTAVYLNDEDIYSDFAIGAFKLPDQRYRDPEKGWVYPGVDKKIHRFPSKTCTLAAIYDVTNLGLLEQMPTVCKHCLKEATLHDCAKFEPLWNEANCQDILNAFYLRYPGILTMRKEDHRRLRRYGYLWDEWGRILHVTAVRSALEWVVSAGLREAGNFPIQSTAQGTIKLVMAQVEDDRQAMGLQDVVKPLLQIHDELLFECHRSVSREWAEHVQMRFEQCVELSVPVKAGCAFARTWGSLPK